MQWSSEAPMVAPVPIQSGYGTTEDWGAETDWSAPATTAAAGDWGGPSENWG